jgi:predicted transposase YbfD/YdcC
MSKKSTEHLKKPIQPYNHPGEASKLIQSIEEIPDPRGNYCNFKHPLTSIIFITLVGTICGANNWPEIVVVGNTLKEWMSRFIALPHGIPSEDTFERVFSMIRIEAFNKFLTDLMSIFRETLGEEIVCFDGKTLRGTAEKGIGKKGLHILNAWSSQNGICIGQYAVDEKSNEITAIPILMEILDLKGCIITADALNTQKTVVKKAVEVGADYVLPVKENHSGLLENIKLFFDEAIEKDFRGIDADHFETLDKDHGRVEKRNYHVIDAEDLPDKKQWVGIKSLGMVIRERSIKDKTTKEIQYYINSIEIDAKLFERCVRGHWSIENGLHWCLDVMLREDQNRYRDRIGAQNLGALRKIVLGVLSKDKSKKRSIASKRLLAGMDPKYREEIIKNLF